MSLLNTKGFNQLTKSRYGYTLYNKHDRYIGKSIEFYGEFSELEAVIFKQICKEGFVVVEVGANIGTHTVALANFVGSSGKVYAFEPQRVVFQTLCANIALNSLTNVYAFNKAVGEKKSFIHIPTFDYNKEDNYGGIEIERFQSGEKIELIVLDEFLEVDRVDFIKVDVEGMEESVLKGAKKLIQKFKPILYVENDRKEKSSSLIKAIKDMGYRLFIHNPPLFNPNNFFNKKENIFKNLVSKNLLCIHSSKDINLKGFVEI